MPTDVQLVNQALTELGQSPIASLGGADDISAACQAIYADTRDAVLLLHPWKFATYQLALTVSPYPPVFKWGHLYPLPDGVRYDAAPLCLKVLTTSEGEGAVYDLGQHLAEGRVLYAHPLALGGPALATLAALPYAIEYTGRVVDLNLWDALALRVLVKMLAATLAKSQTGQTALAEEKLKEALALLPAAQKGQDAQGTPIGLYPSVDALESQLRIINQALGMIGQGHLRSLAEDSAAGYQARLHFATAQAAVLAMHPWNFAKYQATLSQSSYLPPMRWRYAHDLPDGLKYGGKPYCLKVIGTNLDPGDWWEVANNGLIPGTLGVTTGRVLLSQEATVHIEYIGLTPNLTIWSPLAIEALTAMVAARLAFGVVKDGKLALAHEQIARDWIREARKQDAKEGTPIVLRANARLLYGRYASRGAWGHWGGHRMAFTPSTTQLTAPGRTYGMAETTLYAADAVPGGARLVATSVLPAGTRISKVVYQCTVAFGTTGGLTSVDIGEAHQQDRWGQAEGITFGTITGYGHGTTEDFEVLDAQDIWVSANGGTFDEDGACKLYILWERVSLT